MFPNSNVSEESLSRSHRARASDAGNFTIGVLGDIADVDNLLLILNKVPSVRWEALEIFTNDVTRFMERYDLGTSGTRINVTSTDSWEPTCFRKCDFLINFYCRTHLLFEAAVRAIPVITVLPSYMPSVFDPKKSFYEFGRTDVDGLESVIRHVVGDWYEARKRGRESQRRVLRWCGSSYLLKESIPDSPEQDVSLLHSVVRSTLHGCVPASLLTTKGGKEKPAFALTFDDGPDPRITPTILATLRQKSIKATFFLVGSRAELYPELVRSICQEGHEIGCHSYSHPHFSQISMREAVSEIATVRSILTKLTGQDCILYRPPFGELSIQSLVPAWLQKQKVIMWNVDLKDYKSRSACEIEARAANRAFENGDIILYHGTTNAALDALPTVIKAAKAAGRFGVTVSELCKA